MALGDCSSLQVDGQGTILLDLILNGINRRCALKGVLHVPELAHNLVSGSRATQARKTIHFYENSEMTTVRSLQLDSILPEEKVSVAKVNRERLWHCRFGHLSEQNRACRIW